MPYKLREEISFCQVDDRLIFLDIRNDRYFRLPSSLEQAFQAIVDGNACGAPDMAALLEHGVLVDDPAVHATPTTAADPPIRSAMEEVLSLPVIGVAVMVEVFWIVTWTRLQLRTRRLKNILIAVARYRDDHARHRPTASATSVSQSLLQASALFRRARLYVPIETRCLLDSVAMVRFLAKRGMQANIVFAVTGDPFAAHCWAQAGDLVLNDTVGNCHAHTPIRVI